MYCSVTIIFVNMIILTLYINKQKQSHILYKIQYSKMKLSDLLKLKPEFAKVSGSESKGLLFPVVQKKKHVLNTV